MAYQKVRGIVSNSTATGATDWVTFPGGFGNVSVTYVGGSTKEIDWKIQAGLGGTVWDLSTNSTNDTGGTVVHSTVAGTVFNRVRANMTVNASSSTGNTLRWVVAVR